MKMGQGCATRSKTEKWRSGRAKCVLCNQRPCVPVGGRAVGSSKRRKAAAWKRREGGEKRAVALEAWLAAILSGMDAGFGSE